MQNRSPDCTAHPDSQTGASALAVFLTSSSVPGLNERA